MDKVFASGRCTSGETSSEPGTGNTCCYAGTEYKSGEMHKDLTFSCVDGQWYATGLNGDFNPAWTWAKDTQICKKYGPYSSSSTGWYGPIAFSNKDFSKKDKYFVEGGVENIYCGEKSFCDQNQNCVACTKSGDPCNGQTQNKTVFSFYFDWYDTGANNDAYKICGPTYNVGYGYRACNDLALKSVCSNLSVLERTPIFGENSYIKWNNKSMYKADFIRMKRSGIDVSVLVGWPGQPYDVEALPFINQALDELRAEGKAFPKIVLFEALDNWIYNLYPEINGSFGDVNKRRILVNKMADRDIAIWNGLDDKYEYTKDGKKVLWFFRAPENYNSKINCQFYDEFKGELRRRGFETFMVGPSTMGTCAAIDAFHNWGQGNVTRSDQSLATAPDKFVSNKIDVCEVSPGLERNNATKCAGDYATFRDFPKLPRGNGDEYKKSWDYCLKNNEGWVVVQTWNEYYESTGIAPSKEEGFLFNKINLGKVNEFKGSNEQWKDCEIDEECFIDGIQKKCVNNKCVEEVVKPENTNDSIEINLGDADGNKLVNLNDISIWRSEFLVGGLGVEVKNNWKSDFDKDGKVTMVDASIWRENFLNAIK